MVILSWCPGVLVSVTSCTVPRSGKIRDFDFSPCDSILSLVFCDKISCHWVKGVPTNEGEKEEQPLKKALFYHYGSSNVKMVADRHRHAANHKKHW